MRGVEREFLPAALEIERTPPPFAARLLLWTLVLGVVGALVWAIVGEVDVVGIAPGRIVVVGHTKTVQAPEHAVVAAIRVTEGQHVDAGQVLVEFDRTAAGADRARLAADLAALETDRARLLSLVALARGERDVTPVGDLWTGPARRRFEQQRAEYRAALAGIDAELRAARASHAGLAARIDQLAGTLPLVAEEAEAHRQLMGRGIVPRVRWLAVERERITVRQQLAALREERAAQAANIDALLERQRLLAAQYAARWAEELADVDTRLAGLREELAKAVRRLELATLSAPIAGRVQQLAVHTEGGVVTTAQPLLRIVPDDAMLEVEARVLDRDIGFVREGQRAVIKVDSFDFTRYGTLGGRLARLAREAVADEALGSCYLAHIVLDSALFTVDGRQVGLSPGMQVTAEFKFGRRRVIEFLLSPLVRYRQESARER
jgi:hemolysin D